MDKSAPPASAQTRIRWDDSELERLAACMVQLQAADPTLEPLEAVRQAQTCLPANRQRDITTWSMVQLRLQPRLDALRVQSSKQLPDGAAASGETLATTGTTTDTATDAPALGAHLREAKPEGQPGVPVLNAAERAHECRPTGTAVQSHTEVEASLPPSEPREAAASRSAEKAAVPDGRAQLGAAVSGLDPLMTEAAVVAAVRSPAVAQALVDVFSQAMAQAFARFSERGQGTIEDETTAPRNDAARVLLAGFAAPQSKGLEESIRALCEVRVWRPGQGPQLFETLARLCNVAVIPEETEDDVDADLRARNLVVIRHSGSTAKLVERLQAVV